MIPTWHMRLGAFTRRRNVLSQTNAGSREQQEVSGKRRASLISRVQQVWPWTTSNGPLLKWAVDFFPLILILLWVFSFPHRAPFKIFLVMPSGSPPHFPADLKPGSAVWDLASPTALKGRLSSQMPTSCRHEGEYLWYAVVQFSSPFLCLGFAELLGSMGLWF